jgi:hypothetical protein
MNLFEGCFDYKFRKTRSRGSAIMISSSKPLRYLAFAAVAAAALGFVALPARVQAASSPLHALSGSWAGGGTITLASGTKERIRCRARYDVNDTGSTVDLRLRCASDSFTFELQSNAGYQNGAVSGNWSETTRGVGGSIEGSARGNRINVRVSGIISALLAVNTNANQQSISIEAPGTDMAAVAISLSRGAK